ncbi:MAG: hypothetical protein IPH62_10960 [Ignavibacteriae bacterium]|nr:hypothetical protein [Ignavibacteriota bacterium]
MPNTKSDYKKTFSKQLEKSKPTNSIKKFFLNHIFYGLYGFSLFFLFSVFIDFFLSLFDPQKTFEINLFTISIGITGFILAFGFSFLETFRK